MRPGLGVDSDRVGAGLREVGEIGIGRGDHQMHVEGLFRAARARARMTGAPKVMLGTKWPSITSRWIQSAPAGVDGLDLLAEAAEIGGEDGGGDAERASHGVAALACDASRVDGRGGHRLTLAPYRSRQVGKRSPAAGVAA